MDPLYLEIGTLAVCMVLSAFFSGSESALFSLKDMLRYILGEESWTTVGEELAFVGRYCELQRLRFQERLSVSIRCAEEAAAVRIPKLILQPMVENAVIHGIEPLDRTGRLEVEARREENGHGGAAAGCGCTLITVADDGAGFSPGSGDAVERIGLANVRERLMAACPGARMTIESSPGAGTRIALEIPETRGDGEGPDR